MGSKKKKMGAKSQRIRGTLSMLWCSVCGIYLVPENGQQIYTAPNNGRKPARKARDGPRSSSCFGEYGMCVVNRPLLRTILGSFVFLYEASLCFAY